MNTSKIETINPFALFGEWFTEAKGLGLKDPNAMVLATSSKAGVPSARVVLLKEFDERGFTFFTNYSSRKSQDIMENPQAALCFYWEGLGKQIRVVGAIEKASDKESDSYFMQRARGSQIGAWASKQSLPMEDGEALVKRVKEITESFSGADIPRPPFWGGFRLVPTEIEFWKEGEYRLHTRLFFRRRGNGPWAMEMLYP